MLFLGAVSCLRFGLGLLKRTWGWLRGEGKSGKIGVGYFWRCMVEEPEVWQLTRPSRPSVALGRGDVDNGEAIMVVDMVM